MKINITRSLIKKILSFPKIFYYYFFDYLCAIRYSSDGISCSKNIMENQIMLIMHSIEKGMSFAYKKDDWGREKSQYLCNLINSYIKKYGKSEITCIAINILAKYRKDKNSTSDKKIISQIDELIEKNDSIIKESIGGFKEVGEPPIFDELKIREFFSTRSSVRDFSEIPVTDNEILSAMQIAALTPTACNRQTSKVHIIRDRNVIDKLIDNQLGDQGWCRNANVVFVITSNISFFNSSYERYQPMIDGGLYAMNFVWGLHLCHIASCFKMFIREPKLQRNFQNICNIPVNEIPIVLVLAGHYKNIPILSPKSERLDIHYYI